MSLISAVWIVGLEGGGTCPLVPTGPGGQKLPPPYLAEQLFGFRIRPTSPHSVKAPHSPSLNASLAPLFLPQLCWGASGRCQYYDCEVWKLNSSKVEHTLQSQVLSHGWWRGNQEQELEMNDLYLQKQIRHCGLTVIHNFNKKGNSVIQNAPLLGERGA